jgi:hypothetical protein
MLGNRKLVLDTFCEVYELLEPWMDHDFWDFANHEIVPDAIYLISRKELFANLAKVRHMVENKLAHVVFSNPAEGSETLVGQSLRIRDLLVDNRMLLIGGGDMDDSYPCLQYDSFLPKILDYDENLAAIEHSEKIYQNLQKPYKFLFLNGRTRPHRNYLLKHFQHTGLLSHSLWTNLESGQARSVSLRLAHSPLPIQLLDPKYEFDFYRDQIIIPTTDTFVKNHLFKNTWGEIYLKADPYIDTYFSLVTETVFEYPHSFRTEKIWKPIAMGHPWIAVANAGYYRDMRNLGFQTFNGIIDESFDLIDNNQQRIDRIATVVEDLCQQDLASFLKECYTVCKYNQQHLAEMRLRVRREFPDRFAQFIRKHRFDE